MVAISPVASAAVTITGSDQTPGTLITQLPGSPSDFIFFGGPDTLTNFTVDTLGNPEFAPYSSLINPAGNSQGTGIVFSHNLANTNLATFTLGSNPTFNYADFNIYVLYDNTTGDSNSIDGSISIGAGTDATGVSATTVSVTDPVDKPTDAGRIVTFNIQGLAAGDQFTIAALGLPSGNVTDYIGAVSFESAPEPSTYAMIAGGLILLVGALRLKRAGVKA